MTFAGWSISQSCYSSGTVSVENRSSFNGARKQMNSQEALDKLEEALNLVKSEKTTNYELRTMIGELGSILFTAISAISVLQEENNFYYSLLDSLEKELNIQSASTESNSVNVDDKVLN